MVPKVVGQTQTGLPEDFLRKTVIWYGNYRKSSGLKGSGHLGVTLEQLREPFERNFANTGVSFTESVNDMLEKRTLIMFVREKIGGGYLPGLGRAKVLRVLPEMNNNIMLRFYLPGAFGRTLRLVYEKDLQVDQIIREILYSTPASVS